MSLLLPVVEHLMHKKSRKLQPEDARDWLRLAAGAPGENTIRCAAMLLTKNNASTLHDGISWDETDLEKFQLTHRAAVAACKMLDEAELAEVEKIRPGHWAVRLKMPEWPRMSWIEGKPGQSIWR